MVYIYVKKLGRKKNIRNPRAYFAACRRNSGRGRRSYGSSRRYRSNRRY